MLQFVPMTADEYQDYVQRSIPRYAREQVRSNSWPAEEAEARAKQAYAMLLPEGLATPNQFVCSLVDETSSKKVGIIWYGLQKEETGIFLALYDFEVFESCRRKGYGTQALELLDCKANALGTRRIALHVFGRNTAARALYQKAGYEETHVTMIKDLPE